MLLKVIFVHSDTFPCLKGFFMPLLGTSVLSMNSRVNLVYAIYVWAKHEVSPADMQVCQPERNMFLHT